MITDSASHIIINDIEVDFIALKIKVNDNWQNIEARQLKLLKLLVENQGQAVSRTQIMDELWQDTIVSDNSVSKLIAQLRKTLQDDKGTDDRGTATFIRTVPRVGYQLIANVNTPDPPKQAPRDNQTLTKAKPKSIITFAAFILIALATIALNYWLSNHPKTTPNDEQRPQASRLTSMPGPESFLRFSPNGRYLAFNQNANNRQHTDLAIYDNQTQAIHSIKTTGYSEQAPEWSPDGRWLIYYRHDPISCSIRIMSVANPVETWRLSPDFALADCAIGQTRHRMQWVSPKTLYVIHQGQQNKHLSLLTLSTEAKPKVLDTTHFSHINPEHFDINNQQQMLYLEYSAPWYQLKKIDLSELIKPVTKQKAKQKAKQNERQATKLTAKLIQKTSQSLWAVKWHTNNKEYWLGQHQGLSRFKGQSKRQTINLSDGFIADMDINAQGDQLAHSEGLMNINLYAFAPSKSKQPQRISSAARTDLFPTLSPSGEQTLFVSYQRFSDTNNGQKDVWLKHIDKQAATLLTQLDESINPKFILWSPNNDNVLLGDHQQHLHLLNIFSKHLITIVSDYPNLHSVNWSNDGQYIHFIAAQQQWRYDLASSTLQPTKNQPQTSQKTNLEIIKTLNSSYPNHKKLLTEFLSEKLYHHMPIDNLPASFEIYSPKVIESGIYYVIRQGQQLKLYFYHFSNDENKHIIDMGFYQQAINLPLHISTSNDGKQLVYSLIEAIETDILLQPLKD